MNEGHDGVVRLRGRVRDRVHRCQDIHDLTGLLRRSLPELHDVSSTHAGAAITDPAEQLFLRWWGLPHLTRLACRHVVMTRCLSHPELMQTMASQHVGLPLVAKVLHVLHGAVGDLSSSDRPTLASAAQDLLDVCQEKAFERIEECVPDTRAFADAGWNPWPAALAAQEEGRAVLVDEWGAGMAGGSTGLPVYLKTVLLQLLELRHLLGGAEPLACRVALRLGARPDWTWLLARGLCAPAWRAIGHRLCAEAGPSVPTADPLPGWVPLRIAHERLQGTPGISALQTLRRLLPAWKAQGWARKTSERRNGMYEVDVEAVREAYLTGYRTASWDTYHRHPKGWRFDPRHDDPVPARSRRRGMGRAKGPPALP